MKKLILTSIGGLIILNSFSQIAKDYMIGVNLDLIKTDYEILFEKAQVSAELNYFLSKKFTATGGVDYWTGGEQVSLLMGARFYPVRGAFVRLRGLIGANDIALGGGWSKLILPRKNWYWESIADVYLLESSFALRTGFVYIIKRK